MEQLSQRLARQFSIAGLANYVVDVLLPNIFMAGLTMFAFYLGWRLLSRLLLLLQRTHLDETARSFVQQVAKYGVFAMGAASALAQLGVNTASLLTSLGVAGLTLGFAARDTLSNVISGLFIFWDRPFVVGDLVEIGDRYGRVSEITMRSTRVVTPDGKMLAIPNAQIVNSIVASFTNFPHLRVDIQVSVGVGEDLGRVRRLLLDIVEGREGFMSDPKPAVMVTNLGDYSIDLELQAWIDDERTHVENRFRLREELFLALRNAGVEMPFETLQLAPVELRGPASSAVQ
jgi:small conductance mechanosensitive channel